MKSIEALIREAIISDLEGEVSYSVFEFGSRSDETKGAQIIVQCDRPAVADRDKSGRMFEQTFTVVLHVAAHSQWMRENPGEKDKLTAKCDEYLETIDADYVNSIIAGRGECTGIQEQDGLYAFNDNFDDFQTITEIYVIPRIET